METKNGKVTLISNVLTLISNVDLLHKMQKKIGTSESDPYIALTLISSDPYIELSLYGFSRARLEAWIEAWIGGSKISLQNVLLALENITKQDVYVIANQFHTCS